MVRTIVTQKTAAFICEVYSCEDEDQSTNSVKMLPTEIPETDEAPGSD